MKTQGTLQDGTPFLLTFKIQGNILYAQMNTEQNGVMAYQSNEIACINKNYKQALRNVIEDTQDKWSVKITNENLN